MSLDGLQPEEAKALYFQHKDWVLRRASGALGNRALAEEATHEAFASLLKNGYRENAGAALFHYLRDAMKRSMRVQSRTVLWSANDHEAVAAEPLLNWEDVQLVQPMLQVILMAFQKDVGWSSEWLGQLRLLLGAPGIPAGLVQLGLSAPCLANRLAQAYEAVLRRVRKEYEKQNGETLKLLLLLLEKHPPGWNGRQPHGLREFLDCIATIQDEALKAELLDRAFKGSLRGQS